MVYRKKEKWEKMIEWMESIGERFEMEEGVMNVEKKSEEIEELRVNMEGLKDKIDMDELKKMKKMMGYEIIEMEVEKGEI